jgi:hypothetical protein
VAYTGEEWRLREPDPWDAALSGWLRTLGGSGAGVLNDPEEFINQWYRATIDQARRWKQG